MNSRQLQYAILLSKTLNFSQVAEQLNITQPALSKQILSLEKELGVRLFDRNSNPIKLTPAGEFFTQKAEKLLYQQDQLQRSMEQFKTGEAGTLVIGITPFRSSYLMSEVLQKVNQKYPNIRIRLHEIGSDILRKESAEGKYDFAVVNLPVDESLLNVIYLEPDRLWVAVPRNLLHLLPEGEEGRKLSLYDCRALPFVVVSQGQEMRQLFEKLCTEAEIDPYISIEVVGLNTAWSIARTGTAATILPLQFMDHEHLGDNTVLFPLKNVVYNRQPAIVTRRGQYLSAAAQYAIDLLKKSSS